MPVAVLSHWTVVLNGTGNILGVGLTITVSETGIQSLHPASIALTVYVTSRGSSEVFTRVP